MNSKASDRVFGEAEAAVVRAVVDRAIWAFFGALVLVLLSVALRGTDLASPLELGRILAYLFFVYCAYRLSMHVENRRSLAWTIVMLLLLLPPIGWVVAWSLMIKARRMAGPPPADEALA